MQNSDPKKSQKQIDRFRATARDLEAVEDEAVFDKALKRVAKAPQPNNEKSKPKKRGR